MKYNYLTGIEQQNHNIRNYLAATLIGVLMVIAGIAPTFAAGNSQSGATVGDCISDGLYGNEPNIVGPFATGGPAEQEPGTKAGRVVPSQSPGPFVNAGPNEPPRNDRVRGSSVGDFNQQFGGGSVPEFCRTATS
jgi:hypothetical protein